MDDGRAQVTLGAVVGGLDVVTMQEDVEAIAVRAVALLEPRGLSLWSDVAVEDQPIGSVLDQQSAACERLWRDLLAFVMLPDRRPKTWRRSRAQTRSAPVSASLANVRSRA